MVANAASRDAPHKSCASFKMRSFNVVIGGGKALASPPSEPYVRFSRIRLSSREFLSSRLSRRQPGRVKREQPGFREEGIWPALVIGAADSHARRLLLLSAKKGA